VTRACRAASRELLVELQPPAGTPWEGEDAVVVVAACYAGGARPEWWKLPPSPEEALWHRLGELVRTEDPACRGLLVLGSTAEPAALQAAFAAAATEKSCRGFAVGRAIFAPPATAWVRGELSDAGLVAQVAERYAATIASFAAARSLAAAPDAR
jgi:5-dehydro-2-deoxygluconokinase